MGEAHVEDVPDVDVLVERLLDEVLRLVARQVGDAGVQEDEAEVQGGPEHEHVGVELELRDGGRRQGMAHRDQAHVLEVDAPRR